MDMSGLTIKQQMLRIAGTTTSAELKRAAEYEERGLPPAQAEIIAHVDSVMGQPKIFEKQLNFGF